MNTDISEVNSKISFYLSVSRFFTISKLTGGKETEVSNLGLAG